MKRQAKARALLYLAGGRSYAATGREVGVNAKTVAAWMKDPVFAAEADALRRFPAEHRGDAAALLAAVEQAMDRVAASPPKVERPRRVPVNASAEQRARITARYHARGRPGPWDSP